MPIPLIDLKRQYKILGPRMRRAAIKVLDSGVFILGEEGRRFEAEFSRAVGTRYAVGVGSGTEALRLGLEALGVGPGDEVIVPAFTFIATATAVSALGARPVLVDVNPENLTLDWRGTQAAITKKTKAVVPVHLYGAPAMMRELKSVTRPRGIRILEDCAQAHLAVYRGRTVGSIGDMGAFSFYPSKNLGAVGDAGMILTDSPALAESCRVLRNVGRPSHAHYHYRRIGQNSRLDELQAAVLRVKLTRLTAWTRARRRIAALYARGLSGLPLTPPDPGSNGTRHCFHLYVVRTGRRDALKRCLHDAGIGAGVYFPRPLHLEEAYRHLGHRRGRFPVSEEAARTVLALPMFPELRPFEVSRVCRVIRDFFS